MGNFAVYEKCEINNDRVTVQDVSELFRKSLSRYYYEDDVSLKPQGLAVRGNLKSIWERAITKADVQVRIDGNILSYRVEGAASLGKWPWLWLLLGFCTGFFFVWFFWDLAEYIICRDRPKKYFEEAFKEVAFELGYLPNTSRTNEQLTTRSEGRDKLSGWDANMSPDKVYILRDGRQLGPFSSAQIREYVATGNLLLDELAWCQGAPTWIPLSQLPGVASKVPAAAKPPKYPAIGQSTNNLPSVAAKSKFGCWVFSFFAVMAILVLIVLVWQLRISMRPWN